jgi:hypothetical protein
MNNTQANERARAAAIALSKCSQKGRDALASAGAVEALLAYEQADFDGTIVKASRQAIHEVTDALSNSQAHNRVWEAVKKAALDPEIEVRLINDRIRLSLSRGIMVWHRETTIDEAEAANFDVVGAAVAHLKAVSDEV